jgi:arylsulfatase A-like enzyme
MKMKRLIFSVLWMGFWPLFFQPQLAAQPATSQDAQTLDPPNVLFLFADDMRASALTNLAIKTPNLDRLRSRGMLFTEAHIMGADNGAVCAPSRAMLMTGRHLGRLLPGGFNIPDDHALLGETLQSAGYDAFGTGKWHNSRHTFNRNFNHGEHIFMGGMHDPWNTPLYHYQQDAVYTDRRPVIRDDRHSNKVDTLPGEYVFGGIHASKVFADAAIGFIESRRPDDKPFFLYTAFTAPHDPRSMPPEYLEWYDPNSIALPPNFMPEHPFDNGQLIIRDEQLADTPRQPEEIKRHILEYYAMISHLDVQVGRIMDALERSGQLDNTIIVFAGDNGLAVGQHGLMGKQNLYQHSVNVPLLMAGPGIPRGDSTPALCYLIDLFPTLCDLAGAKVPNGLDGRSLVPVIKREQKTVRNVLHLQYKDLQGAIRKGNTKLIRYWVDGLETLQLFDLEQDPREVRNLAGQYPEKVSVLKRELLEWDKQHGLASQKSQK